MRTPERLPVAAAAILAAAITGAACDDSLPDEEEPDVKSQGMMNTPEKKLAQAFDQLNAGLGAIGDLQRALREELGMPKGLSVIDGCFRVAADTAHRANMTVCVGCSSHAEGGRILMGTTEASPEIVAEKRAMELAGGGAAGVAAKRKVVSTAGDEVVCASVH